MITLVIVALVIVGLMLGYVKLGTNQVQPDNQDVISFGNDVVVGESDSGMIAEPGESQSYTVEITSSGFSPTALNVNQGDVVTFINKGSSSSWPASAIHPTHTVYPGSDIKKCGGSEEEMIFDACKGLKTGESWTFTFNEVGTWSYHDHLSTGRKGTIVVN